MKVINNQVAQTERLNGRAVIIDVRTPAEFVENHIPGAVNSPSSAYQRDFYTSFGEAKIVLVCESGDRAKKIGVKLKEDGVENIYLLEKQMQDIPAQKITSGWTIDRQFRITLGILLAIFLSLHFIGSVYAIVIPIILSTGLILTALIDRCYMRMGIGMLPWNKGKNMPK